MSNSAPSVTNDQIDAFCERMMLFGCDVERETSDPDTNILLYSYAEDQSYTIPAQQLREYSQAADKSRWLDQPEAQA
jgi:hypothetical protein